MGQLQTEFKLTVQDALSGKVHSFSRRSLQWLKPRHVGFGVGQNFIEESLTELGLSKNPGVKKITPRIKQKGDSSLLNEVQQSP